jgi:hypothetical protein
MQVDLSETMSFSIVPSHFHDVVMVGTVFLCIAIFKLLGYSVSMQFQGLIFFKHMQSELEDRQFFFDSNVTIG